MIPTISGRSLNRVTRRTEHWTFPLRALAEGRSKGPVRYRGRRALTERIRPGLQAICAGLSRSSATSMVSLLGFFWRFLDDHEDLSRHLTGVDPIAFDDLKWLEIEALWRPFLNWLGGQKTNRRYQINRAICIVFSQAYQLSTDRNGAQRELDIYLYFKSENPMGYSDDPLTFEEAKSAFAALGVAWRAIVRRIEVGRALADRGRDPRQGSSGLHRWSGGLWKNLANRLWLVRHQLPFGEKISVGSVLTARRGFATLACEPLDGADASTSATGLWAHVSAVFLRWQEIAIALAMVCIKTGLNVDTIARMRAADWYRTDPLRPDDRVILHGPKRIAGERNTASSSIHRATDAYQIIKHVVELTQPLRDRAKEVAMRTGDRRLAEMAELIWIWPTPRGLGNLLPGTSTRDPMHKHLDALFKQSGLTRQNGSPVKFRFSHGRDIFALFVFHRSGFDLLRTAQALTHKGLRSLLAYIEKKAVRVADRIRLIRLQGLVLTDVRAARYNPTDYRESVPGIRTSQGLTCTNPSDPPPEADPGNVVGGICRKQRCWACTRWYAAKDSLPYLIRITGELRDIRAETPFAVWEASTYVEVLAVYDYIISRFDPKIVDEARKAAAALPPIVKATRFSVGAAV